MNEPAYFATIVEQTPPTWGEGCIIGAYCVLGVQPIPTAANRRQVRADWPAGRVGSRTVIGHHCVIGAGVVIGEDCRIGDHVNIREGVKIGDRCVIGTKVDIQFEVNIGNDVRIFNETQIAGGMVIGDETFVGPGVQTANDPYLAHFDLGDYQDRGLAAPTIGRKVFIGVGAILLPGVKIGDSATIGAGALVSSDVAPGAVILADGVRGRPVPLRMHAGADAA